MPKEERRFVSSDEESKAFQPVDVAHDSNLALCGVRGKSDQYFFQTRKSATKPENAVKSKLSEDIFDWSILIYMLHERLDGCIIVGRMFAASRT